MSNRDAQLQLFPRGPGAGARLLIYVLISIAMIVADSRFRVLDGVRSALSTLLYPIQEAVQAPLGIYDQVSGFFVNHADLQRDNAMLRQRNLDYAGAVLRYRDLEQENNHLRTLLDAHKRTALHTRLAEIISVPRDPYSRKIIVDHGSQSGVRAGQPVMDELGLLGQVTRVYPYTSEITLLTDAGQPVPVQIQRNGLRAIAFGSGTDGVIEVRYLPQSADIRSGDVLVTSGIDGVYPPGLPVATVTRIERSPNRPFLRVECTPKAAINSYRQVLIVDGTPAAGKAPPTPHVAQGKPK
ncbi:MAG TPA: rod shape-determining protein MreC [Sulfuriferula sp.]|nr:rod shape-determining protein MreC [Sulfuriferula sp.]